MKEGKIVFTGHFGEYLVISIGLSVLSAILLVILFSYFSTLVALLITLVIIFPYFSYWMFAYFFTRLEIEIYDSKQDS